MEAQLSPFRVGWGYLAEGALSQTLMLKLAMLEYQMDDNTMAI
jgi:hypothetical protein